MASHHSDTFMGDFKRFFGRGLAVLLPSVLTLWILWAAFSFVFTRVAEPINAGIRGVVIRAAPYVVPPDRTPSYLVVTTDEMESFRQSSESRRFRRQAGEFDQQRARAYLVREQFREYWSSHWYLAGAGLVVAIVLIYLAGLLLGGLIGRRIYSRLEDLISRIPGFKQVYPHVKQLVDLVMGERKIAFNRVVLIQYPRQGLWTVGFVTGASLSEARRVSGVDCISVFIPSTPTPFTGFTITVPATDAIDLPITIDEAIRFIITGGALVPAKDAGAAAAAAARAHAALKAPPASAADPALAATPIGSSRPPTAAAQRSPGAGAPEADPSPTGRGTGT